MCGASEDGNGRDLGCRGGRGAEIGGDGRGYFAEVSRLWRKFFIKSGFSHA